MPGKAGIKAKARRARQVRPAFMFAALPGQKRPPPAP